LAKKKKKGKSGGKSSTGRRTTAFIILILLIAGGYLLIKPLQKKYFPTDTAKKVYSVTDRVLEKFGASLIVIDSREESTFPGTMPVRKKVVRAYSRQEARRIADALKKASDEDNVLYTETPYAQAGDDEEGYRISLGNDSYTLQEIILTFDRGRGKEKKTVGKLAVIIDDIGENPKTALEFATLNFPVTLSILPGLDNTAECARIAKKNNKEIMLHCPMEPLNGKMNPGEGVLKASMGDDEILKTLRKNIDSVKGVKGINNHMGSKFTTNIRGLNIVMKELKARKLFFVDSRTNSDSRAYEIARKAGVKAGRNDLFIDTKREIPLISKKLSDAAEIAAKKGNAIVIGHPDIETLAALKIKIPKLRKKGLEIVFAFELVK